MPRLLHTSDWHLGHRLHAFDRSFEHARFLAWLERTIVEREVDVLLVAGDVYDAANPPAEAQSAFYAFIARAHAARPGLQIVVIAGNHDSPSRLEAPDPILAALRVRVVGSLARGVDELLVPLADARGAVAGWCAAVPYLRAGDLPEGEGGFVAAMRALHTRLFERARANGGSLVAMGHGYFVGGELSELSERRIQSGYSEALPADLYGDDVAYAALGHLHKAQRIAQRENVRYSGSPIPLSITEAEYAHQVVLVDLDGALATRIETLRIPRAVDMVRIGARDPRPLTETLALLAAHPFRTSSELPIEEHPYLDVHVTLEKPEPRLRADVESALSGKAVRLLRIAPHYPASAAEPASYVEAPTLERLQPEEVFASFHQEQYGTPPAPELRQAFRDIAEARAETTP